jgi:hypothetical protein
LLQALVHLLKAEGRPLARDVGNWRGDARGFCAQARRRLAASMRRNIDLAGIYADALKALPDTINGQPPQPVSQTCPMTLDKLIAA